MAYGKRTRKTKGEKFDPYQAVADKILSQMEAGTSMWQKPWNAKELSIGGSMMPRNVMNGNPYRGINIGILFDPTVPPLWATFKQWLEIGGAPRKGEKGTQIVFWKKISKTETDDNGEDKDTSFMMMRLYSVFNISQIVPINGEDGETDTKTLSAALAKRGYNATVTAEGVTIVADDDATEKCHIERIAHVESYVANCLVPTDHGGNRACYNPLRDRITMPHAEAFKDTDHGTAIEHYYGTLLHELGHATGHKDRLNRPSLTEYAPFGGEKYAFEELVAETTAAFACMTLGLSSEPRPDHAAYLSSWMKAIKDDPKAITKAFSLAQKAVEWMNDRQPAEAAEGDRMAA